ncbi:hypothetical protein I6N95_18005 [Vagococcus sp. BWB3-3]|uniref:Uncharacterized protein n=1 Tax=Vagococcus allomyrinae TaxID=2794353 RepID=A0A940STA2_9ENTE|nr:stage II sporulation protein M [Vagococcus allomyrinae]MBP1042912.1 hypothetical protein [Vagococcus allomyrinae]
MYKLSWKVYLKYFFLMSVIFYLLIINFKGLIGLKEADFDEVTVSGIEIIFHNLMLYIKWQVFFLLSPIFFVFETLVLSWSIKTGIVTFGLDQAIDKLWRHGIIEIPNMFLYQLLSFRLLYYWWKNKSFATIKEYIKENKKIYLLSGLLIIGSGIIEGITW